MVVRTEPFLVVLFLLVLHELKLGCEAFLTVMTSNVFVQLSTIVIDKTMVDSSMFYHIIFSREHCFTTVAGVLGAVHVHHVIDMSILVIGYEVTVVTFDNLFIEPFMLLDMLSELLV